MIVEDSAVVRQLLAHIVSRDPRLALAAAVPSAEEALAELERVRPDVISMDIRLPGMDGLEATRRLRADPRFAKLPIIAITAKAMKDDQEQCMRAGASDYLAKPIDLDRLYSLLRVWLPSVERL
jgi:CheY-like chemotaxis protein